MLLFYLIFTWLIGVGSAIKNWDDGDDEELKQVLLSLAIIAFHPILFPIKLGIATTKEP